MIKFDTPEEYLEYQEILIRNWKTAVQCGISENKMSSHIYRCTGRTTAALTAAVELAKQGKLVTFYTHNLAFAQSLQKHSVIAEYKDWMKARFRYSVICSSLQVVNLKFSSYSSQNEASRVDFNHIKIYDHSVFESCKPPKEYTSAEIAFRGVYGHYPLEDPKPGRWRMSSQWDGFKRGFEAGKRVVNN